MRPRASSSILIAILLLNACSEEGGTPPSADSPGLALYQKARCDSCHGPNGEGLPRVGPRLASIASNWTRAELAAYIEDPAPFRSSKPHLERLARDYFAHMRPFRDELSAEERLTLADWLLARP